MTKTFPSAAQPWLNGISVMMQSVLFSAIRGPDGFRKHHPAKPLLKWYRRCVLISAFDGKTLDNPYEPGGGSFTGPSVYRHTDALEEGYFYTASPGYSFAPYYLHTDWQRALQHHVDEFVHSRDEMTLHYYAHAMHAFGIIGYEHPDREIRQFWHEVYCRMCTALHLPSESQSEMRRRLGDDQEQWALLADEAGSCSE